MIFIDALDEIGIIASQGETKSNKLHLPEVEVSGVHFVFSERVSSEGDLQGLQKLPPHTHHFDLGSGMAGEIHNATVERYVESVCEDDPRIENYHLLTSVTEKEEFVHELCADAGHNFMILRCALNETALLAKIGGEIRLVADLEVRCSPEIGH